VDDLKRNVSGHLTVGAILTIAPFVLPALIEKFQNRPRRNSLVGFSVSGKEKPQMTKWYRTP
jgi:hypothetical protein